MATNNAMIVVHPRQFEFRPACPRVKAGYEDLCIGIYWDDNRSTWDAVTVQNFRDDAGNPIPTEPEFLTFLLSEGNRVKRLNFLNLVADDAFCKYDVVYKVAGSHETFTVDPTVLLKRGP